MIENLPELITQFTIKLVSFLVAISVTWLAGGFFRKLSVTTMNRAKLDKSLVGFISKLIRWLILSIGVISSLGIFGIQTASFAALLAGAGMAIGMALQGTLGNFAAGVMLLLFRPFKLEDVVSVGGQTGVVKEIDVFNTVLDTFDNRRIIIPNGQVFGSKIENITFHPNRRVSVDVGSGYNSDLDTTRKILRDAALRIEGILKDPAPAVVLLELGESSINWSVRVWAPKEIFWDVKDSLTREIKYALDKEGISIPYPQMDLHLQDMSGQKQ
ncbi:MAG: mechanosensitive ion channel [Bacteriovoracaceae bacterium]|jgi:small conductance mechanosensitive channel|nr:mechanosensitive ion channel [Bacteriovoracaceae bacterium]